VVVVVVVGGGAVVVVVGVEVVVVVVGGALVGVVVGLVRTPDGSKISEPSDSTRPYPGIGSVTMMPTTPTPSPAVEP
jgi:hypothetical protein